MTSLRCDGSTERRVAHHYDAGPRCPGQIPKCLRLCGRSAGRGLIGAGRTRRTAARLSLIPRRVWRAHTMPTIGVDTHKATLAACAVDELGGAVAEASFPNDPAGHRAFVTWARSVAPGGRVGIEGSSSFGAPLARFAQAD